MNEQLRCPFTISDEIRKIIPIDEWVPKEHEQILNHYNGFIVMPIAEVLGVSPDSEAYVAFNNFSIIKKRCYNSDKMRPHTCHYVNYFMKFYDTDKELLTIYAKLKYLIDCVQGYNEDAFKYDIARYLLSPSMRYKVMRLNDDNYTIDLKYKKGDQSLQYNNQHGKILMQISIFMNIVIPLMTHFIHIKKVAETNDFILSVYDIILSTFESADIFNKLYETSITNTEKSQRDHSIIWDKQGIRGKNITTHALDIINNILWNIMPKYTYSQNIINFNYQAIIHSTRYQVTDIGYDYNFIPLSASNRDEDNNSEFDKFESYLIKQDESLYMQNVVNCEKTMENIEVLFGPFNQDEVEFYMSQINIMNIFQKNLVLQLFYKYFGDPVSIKAINKEQYIKLLIAAKKMLLLNGLRAMPYILSSKITKQVDRKTLNKREHSKLIASPYYQQIRNNYRNAKIEKYILATIASILSSDFDIVDYYDQELDGQKLIAPPDIIVEEMLIYINLIS